MFFSTKRIIIVVRNVLFMKSQITITPTLLDYAILGLLHHQDLSGYRIRKMFEETALGNYSSSPGTIYPALKRMQKLILIEKVVQNNSEKTLFHINNKGLGALKSWLLKPLVKIDIERKNHELLLRFAFMDTLIKQKEKVTFLESFKTLQSDYINELQLYHKEEAGKMSLHAKLAFEYGIESNKTTLKWCTTTLKEILKNNIS